MSKCRDMEGALAASLYENLDVAEQEALQAHLASCASCRSEYQSLQALVGAMPNEPAVLSGDLLPAIQEELRRSAAVPVWVAWRQYIGLFASVLVVFGVYILVSDRGVEAPAAPVTPVAALSPADVTLAEARGLVASGDAAGALALLQRALITRQDAPYAGPLHLEIANLEYSVFHRYDASYEAYRVVRERFGEAWTQSPGIVKERFDLLTEARDADYEPLYQIDAAARQGESGMPVLEQVMARYPGRGLAQAAMEIMVAMADGEGLSALEDAKSRCSNPIAIAQLDVRLGEGYCTGNQDPARGKALLHAVAESPYEVPADMAKAVLARLETGEQ